MRADPGLVPRSLSPTPLPAVDLEDASRLATEPVVPEVVEPLVAEARHALDDLLESWPGVFAPSAREGLLGGYVQGLARLTNLVIFQRFSSFQLVRNPLWRPPPAPPGDAPDGGSRAVLDAYVEWEAVEHLLGVDGPYPELGRLLTEWRRNWLAGVGELATRWRRHRSELAGLLPTCPQDPGPVTGVRFGISDPHGGGRSAAILETGAGKVVYKPRSVDGEVAWSELVGRILPRALGLDVFGLRAVAGDGYGFLEHVDQPPCRDLDGVRRCYRRYGGLLALAHGLGTIDLHHENVIVCGEQPVVVDAEPLFRGRLALSGQGEARLALERNLSLQGLDSRESVLDLGILPISFQARLPSAGDPERHEYEIGALTAYGRDGLPDLLPCGRGSDALQMRQVWVSARTFPNLPRLGDSVRLPRDHDDDIVGGFEAVHRWLVENRRELLAADGPVRAFSRARVRLLVRPTMGYSTLLARSLSPEPLRSPEARRQRLSADLEVLGEQRFDDLDALVDRELDELLVGDIPRFELAADEDSCGRARLSDPPLAAAENRLKTLDDPDRRLQVVSIRERLQARGHEVAESVPRGTDPISLERHALAVVDALVESVQDRETAPTWVYCAFAPGFGSTMVHADRESLYEGSAGTAVAVAEAGRLAGRPDWCRLAARVFSPLAAAEPTSLERGGGIARGLGGLLYAMLRVADAAADEELLDTAVRLAVEHGPRLAADDGLDEVLNGRAGLLLALVALHRRRPGEALRGVADVAARELLGRARSDERGAFWQPEGSAPMANVTHGAVGIAMALARYARLRDDDDARTAALDALRFDDLAWVTDERGWRDTRYPADREGPRTTWSWCNGRTGALLARHAVAEALGEPADPLIHEAVRAEPDGVLDDSSPGLCCGTPGAVDALLHLQPAGDGTGGAGAGETTRGGGEAVTRGTRLLAETSTPSHYSTLVATLFTGTAGLAFGLLRAARPAEVSSLLWLG